MRDSTITQKKTPKHVVVIANISIPAEENKLSCVLTTIYIVFISTGQLPTKSVKQDLPTRINCNVADQWEPG